METIKSLNPSLNFPSLIFIILFIIIENIHDGIDIIGNFYLFFIKNPTSKQKTKDTWGNRKLESFWNLIQYLLWYFKLKPCTNEILLNFYSLAVRLLLWRRRIYTSTSSARRIWNASIVGCARNNTTRFSWYSFFEYWM